MNSPGISLSRTAIGLLWKTPPPEWIDPFHDRSYTLSEADEN